MQSAVSVAQTVLAILLIVLVFFELRGQNIGGFLSGAESSIHRTRRGFERTLFNATVLVSILFFAVSIWSVILSSQG